MHLEDAPKQDPSRVLILCSASVLFTSCLVLWLPPQDGSKCAGKPILGLVTGDQHGSAYFSWGDVGPGDLGDSGASATAPPGRSPGSTGGSSVLAALLTA